MVTIQMRMEQNSLELVRGALDFSKGIKGRFPCFSRSHGKRHHFGKNPLLQRCWFCTLIFTITDTPKKSLQNFARGVLCGCVENGKSETEFA